MLARYLKALLVVLVRGGVVGPIFIVTYFGLPIMTGSFGSEADSIVEQSTSWLLWVGLLITVADVLVAIWLANGGTQSSAKMTALRQIGVLAAAQIRGFAETGVRINDHPVVKLEAAPLMEILQIYQANNLPFGGTVDIRNYPAVRQQVLAVVRRAAEAQQPASAGGVAAPPQQSTAERLDELQKLHISGAI